MPSPTPPAPPKPDCPKCKGKGEIKVMERHRPLEITTRCPYCDGTGKDNAKQRDAVEKMDEKLAKKPEKPTGQ